MNVYVYVYIYIYMYMFFSVCAYGNLYTCGRLPNQLAIVVNNSGVVFCLHNLVAYTPANTLYT